MLKEGMQHTSSTVVSVANSARAMGSGDLDVFATPSMVALMENAAMQVALGHLPEGSTTVGTEINTTHIKPSPIGETIHASATLVNVEGRKLTFKVEAHDSKGIIGEGTHVRFVVDKKKFLAKVYPKG